MDTFPHGALVTPVNYYFAATKDSRKSEHVWFSAIACSRRQISQQPLGKAKFVSSAVARAVKLGGEGGEGGAGSGVACTHALALWSPDCRNTYTEKRSVDYDEHRSELHTSHISHFLENFCQGDVINAKRFVHRGGENALIRSANIALVSPTHVAARAVALDTDFGLHFLHVRPPASKLDSVRLVGGGALKKG